MSNEPSRSPEALRALLLEAGPWARARSGVRPGRTWAAILGDWGVVALAVLATFVVDHPLVWLLAALLIATRQHGLLILLHDALHWRLFRDRRANDAVANLLLGWPLLVDVGRFRYAHLAHHAHVGTELDPDWPLRHGRRDWQYPKRGGELVAMYARQLLGEGLVNGFRNLTGYARVRAPGQAPRRAPWSAVGQAVYLLVVLGGVTLLGQWPRFLVLWVVPALLVLPTLMRFRAAAEHASLPGRDELDISRDYHGHWLVEWLLVPHAVNLHLVHHLFPGVPFHELRPLAAELYAHPYFARFGHVNRGMLVERPGSLLWDWTRGPVGE